MATTRRWSRRCSQSTRRSCRSWAITWRICARPLTNRRLAWHPMRHALGIGFTGIFAFFALVGVAAAQESPELPAKAATEAQPVTNQEIRFYKGKGPGRGHSYVERDEE